MKENPEMKNDQAAAICLRKYEGSTGMSDQRKIGFDTATLDDKVLVDDDDFLVMPAVIASEIVHQYDDGWAYKPAREIEKMTRIAADIGSVPVKILEHPGAATNYLLVRQSDVYGRAENFRFAKNLKDPKTGRPMRRGSTADVRWFKDRVPEKTIEQIVSSDLRDVSIGFTFDVDQTPGAWNGVKYDYVQRNIFLNHVAAPIQAGRCPGPICGIGYDASLKYGLDAKTLKECPVCSRIVDVGLPAAGKRLYAMYGGDVLEVIEGNMSPAVAAKPICPENDLDKAFRDSFRELNSRLQKK
jgi:hypothetical protein